MVIKARFITVLFLAKAGRAFVWADANGLAVLKADIRKQTLEQAMVKQATIKAGHK